jgi:hypothetical protein
MKNYTIKNTDIMHKGIIFPEGSTIDLDDKDAQSLSNYLEEIKDAPTKNTEQSTKIKRSK